MRRAIAGLALCLLAALAASSAALADPAPPGSTWTQGYIGAPDGTRLHYDMLRPAGLPAGARTPVILSIGPYFNHSGQTGPSGPVENTPYDPTQASGPSARFFDFVNGAKLMQRGYTYVMVDLRGFGGSTGCLDWVGPGEQSDVRTAVEWAAGQPWSTGRVGMYGKSYDGVTGLVGLVQRPRGLAAVVSQEPVYDLYRYLYTNRVRFSNSVATPALYDGIAATPGTAGDELAYHQSSLNDPACLVGNWASQQSSDHGSAYWRARDLISRASHATTPLFLTQGFIEDNTKPDGAYDFFNSVRGPKRAWFGMWDHVRGNDTDANGRLKMGRAGWFDEVMRFFDHYVRDVPLQDAPTDRDPPVAVETSDGSWHSETGWPPPDARSLTARLRPGTYTDDATNNGTAEGGPPNGQGIWTFSPAFGHTVHMAGVPHLTANVATTLANANLTADVYDVDAQDMATLISRSTYLVPGSGRVSFDLYGDDWTMPAGHRLGVLLTSSNAEWWAHTPTLQPVTVSSASLSLPFLRYTRPNRIQGDPSVKLEAYKGDAPFAVPAATIAAATDPAFPVPSALTAPPPAPRATRRAAGRRLVARIAAVGGRRPGIVVYGNAPSGWRVTVSLRRGRRLVAVRRVRARYAAFRVRIRIRRAGVYRARVTARSGRSILRAGTRTVHSRI